jgi:predicted Zn-dependent peptidase
MDVAPRFGTWRRETIQDNVAVPRVFIASRSPVFGSDDYYAANFTAAILGTGRGCRLHQRLVREQQVASAASAFTFDLSKGSDLLVVDATARPGVPAEQLEAALVSVLDELVRDGPRPGEIERVLALAETAYVGGMQSVAERADQLSRFATYFDDPSLVNEQVVRYRGVTDEAVRAFAASTLGPDNRASLVYVPASGSEAEAA